MTTHQHSSCYYHPRTKLAGLAAPYRPRDPLSARTADGQNRDALRDVWTHEYLFSARSCLVVAAAHHLVLHDRPECSSFLNSILLQARTYRPLAGVIAIQQPRLEINRLFLLGARAVPFVPLHHSGMVVPGICLLLTGPVKTRDRPPLQSTLTYVLHPTATRAQFPSLRMLVHNGE